MFSNYRNTLSKLDESIWRMATSAASVQERLRSALNSLLAVDLSCLSEELQGEFSAIMTEASHEPPRNSSEGRLQATLLTMAPEAAEELAERLVAFRHEVARESDEADDSD